MSKRMFPVSERAQAKIDSFASRPLSEKLAIARDGAYECAAGTPPENALQVFGASSYVNLFDLMSVEALALERELESLRRQLEGKDA